MRGRIISIVTAIAMLIGLFAGIPAQTVLAAGASADISNVAVSIDTVGGKVTVQGAISTGAGKEVTIKVVNTTGNVDYAGQTTSGAGGNFTFTYTPNGPLNGKYTLKIGGENVTAPYDGNIEGGPVATSHTITASAGANGSISPSGAVAVNEGASQTFTITPDAGYQIDKVLVDGSEAAANGGSYTFTNVTADHTINVTFKGTGENPPVTHTITASAGTHGSISPSGAVTVNEGAGQTFTITPDAGYQINKVLVDGSEVTVNGGSYAFTNVTADHTISATFKVVDGVPSSISNVTLSVDATANKVTVQGVMASGAGKQVTIKVINSAGNMDYIDQATSGANGSFNFTYTPNGGLNGKYTFRIGGENVTTPYAGDIEGGPVTASHTITASAGANGSISPSGAVAVNEGASQTFTITPDAGYQIDKVLVDGSEVAAGGGSYTFTNVTADHTISATFKATGENPPVTHTITASAAANGSISPSGAVAVNEGASQTFTITPNAGYRINKVIVDGSEVAVNGGSYTFTNVTANHTISVTFAVISSGGGSGGSGSGGGTVPPTPPVENTEPEGGKIKTEVPTVTNGVAETQVSPDAISKALNGAAADQSGVKTVTLEVPAASGANEYRQTLPAGLLTSNNAETRVNMVTEIARVEVPSNMFGNTALQASTVGVSVARADRSSLKPEVAQKIGNKPVIELSAYADGRKISWSNSAAPVKVYIRYNPGNEELANSEFITVWYIDGAGNAVPVTNARYNRSTGEVSFTTTHFSKYAVAYAPKAFKDLDNYAWAKQYIEVMAAKGVINGTSADSYNPSASITRADFMKLLVSTLDLHAEFTDNFADVRKDAYYYDAIGIAKKLGIATGVGNGMFNPSAAITRQDLMVLTAKALKLAKGLEDAAVSDIGAYTDVNKVAGYAQPSVAAMIKAGIIQGSGGSINPLNNTTRAEVAVIMYRLYNK